MFTRQGQTWLQLGAKLTGPGGFFFGTGVLSADGSSALIGGAPLAQVFTRSGSSWVPQLNAITHYRQIGFGEAVAFSGDGKTALLAGSQDCGGGVGVAGSFVDTSAGWAAEPQLVASGAQVGRGAAPGDQALSGDGSIAVLGGSPIDGSEVGGVWTFVHRTVPFTVPAVTGVTPNAASPGGIDTQVAITGSGFSGTTSVTFGGVPASYFCVVSPSEILAAFNPTTLGPATLEPADVVLTTPAGRSPTPPGPNLYVTSPSTPTGVRATAGEHAATVTFTASPATGSPIIYTIRSDPFGRTVQTGGTRAAITGLTPGRSYTFTVLASDPLGSSPPSTPSNAVMAYSRSKVGGVRVSGLLSRAPRLRFTLHAGTGTGGLRLVTIAMPPGLRFRTIRHGISISVNHHLRLLRGRVRIVLNTPARDLRIAIVPPALAESARLTRRARTHAHARQPLTLRFTITVADPDGTTTTLHAAASFR